MEIVNEGLIAAFDVDAEGRVVALTWSQIDAPVPIGGWRWIHMHRNAARSQAWLLDGDIPPNPVAWALMAEDTRPRFTALDGGDVLFLRGVNLNDGAEPEDMVSVRLYISDTHVVSVAIRRLRAVGDLIALFEAGQPPSTTGAFVEDLIHDLRQRVEPVLDELEDVIEIHELDAIKDTGVPSAKTRNAFTDARQDAVILRRHLVPQASALREIVRRKPTWLVSAEALEEEAVAFERVVEDLDTLRERAAVLRDEMSARLAERANDIVLVLSVVSAVFLPITFLTGLMGMNVGGLPLAETRYGFLTVCLFMLAVTGGTAFWLWRVLRAHR